MPQQVLFLKKKTDACESDFLDAEAEESGIQWRTMSETEKIRTDIVLLFFFVLLSQDDALLEVVGPRPEESKNLYFAMF